MQSCGRVLIHLTAVSEILYSKRCAVVEDHEGVGHVSMDVQVNSELYKENRIETETQLCRRERGKR